MLSRAWPRCGITAPQRAIIFAIWSSLIPFFGPLKLSEANAPSTNALPGAPGYTAYPGSGEFRFGGQAPGQDYIGLIAQELNKRFPGLTGMTTYPGQGGSGIGALGFNYNGPTQESGTLEGIGAITPESLTALLSGVGAPQTVEQLIGRVQPTNQPSSPSVAGQSSLTPTNPGFTVLGTPQDFGIGDTGGGGLSSTSPSSGPGPSPGAGELAGLGPAATAGIAGVGSNLSNPSHGAIANMGAQLTGLNPGTIQAGMAVGGLLAGSVPGIGSALAGILQAGNIINSASAQINNNAQANAINAENNALLGQLSGGELGIGAGQAPAAQGPVGVFADPGTIFGGQGSQFGQTAALGSGFNIGTQFGTNPGAITNALGEQTGRSQFTSERDAFNTVSRALGLDAEGGIGGGPGAEGAAADAGAAVGNAGVSSAAAEGAAAAAGAAAGGGDSGSGEGASVICTHLHSLGYMSDEIYQADSAFGKTVDPQVYRGYVRWARPFVTMMKTFPITTPLVAAIAKPWAIHMAYRMGVSDRDSTLGKMMMKVGWKVCSALGRRVSAGESVPSV